MPSDRERRAELLRSLGGPPDAIEDVLDLDDRRGLPPGDERRSPPLDDELHVEVWSAYAAEGRRRGVLPTLAQRLVQLRFPVALGISKTEAYRVATRRGEAPPEASPPVLADPRGLKLFLQPSPAGAIPVLQAARRQDFVALFRALAARNEPVEVPSSQNACMISGLVNWDRVQRYRAAYLAEGGSASDWPEEMARMARRKELYQDRLLVLGPGPYSGLAAVETGLGLDEQAWAEHSLTVRRVHETTHYLIARCLAPRRQGILEELLADWAGLVTAFGHYPARLACRLLGVETPGAYRSGGRLENYRDGLSTAAFSLVAELARRGVERLASLTPTAPEGDASQSGGVLAGVPPKLLLELAAGSLESLVWAAPPTSAPWPLHAAAAEGTCPPPGASPTTR